MKSPIAIQSIAGCALFICATASFSHVVLETKVAQAGSDYQAAFLVGHGCAGSPTTAVNVQIPPGFEGAMPVNKAGWSVAIERSKLAKPYIKNGTSITEDTARVVWTATGKEFAVQDGKRERFELSGKVPAAVGPLWFKVLQTCETGTNNWSEIPSQGILIAGLKSPAALLEVTTGAAVATLASASAAPVQVSSAWVRSTVAGQKGTGAFMQITARQALRLVGVSSPVAAVSEVHEMKMEGDVMKMRQVSGVDLPAGVAVELKPGGYHLMLMDLKQPVLPSSTVPLTLRFVDAKGIESKMNVNLTASTSAPAAGGHSAGKVDGASEHKH